MYVLPVVQEAVAVDMLVAVCRQNKDLAVRAFNEHSSDPSVMRHNATLCSQARVIGHFFCTLLVFNQAQLLL